MLCYVDGHCCHMGTVCVPDRVKPSFVIFRCHESLHRTWSCSVCTVHHTEIHPNDGAWVLTE